MGLVNIRELCTASTMDRVMNCEGSALLCLQVPEESEVDPEDPDFALDAAGEGTELHFQVERCLRDNVPLEDIEDDAVKICVEEIRATHSGPYILEQRLPLLGSSGQIDCLALDPVKRCAYVWDYKFGMGVRVSSTENPQQAFYAAAVRAAYPWVKRVTVTVIQPRIAGVFDDVPAISSWTLPYQTIDAWARKIDQAITKAETGRSLAMGDWCRFCKARPICPVYTAQVAKVVSEVELVTAPEVEDKFPVSINELARWVLQRDRVVGWFNKAHAYLEARALEGVPIPGFELRQKRAHRAWHMMMEPEEIAEILKEKGIDDPWEPRTLRSPAQMEKLKDKNGKKVKIDFLAEKPLGGMALKPIKED